MQQHSRPEQVGQLTIPPVKALAPLIASAHAATHKSIIHLVFSKQPPFQFSAQNMVQIPRRPVVPSFPPLSWKCKSNKSKRGFSLPEWQHVQRVFPYHNATIKSENWGAFPAQQIDQQNDALGQQQTDLIATKAAELGSSTAFPHCQPPPRGTGRIDNLEKAEQECVSICVYIYIYICAPLPEPAPSAYVMGSNCFRQFRG